MSIMKDESVSEEAGGFHIADACSLPVCKPFLNE